MGVLKSRGWLQIVVVLALAFGLRIVNLSARSLWYDEAFAALFAETGWDAMVDGTLGGVDGGAAEEHPLLYYQTLNWWMQLFGQSSTAVRMYSVVAGTLTVLLVYYLARDWFGSRAALTAMMITALAPFHVQYSQETRMYALLTLVLTAATWMYWRAWQRQQVGYWIAFGVLAGIGMHVQQLAAMVLLALGMLPFVLRDRRRIVWTGAAALLALAIYFPWLLHLPDQLGKLERYWVARPNVLHLWLALRSFVSVNLDFAPAWWLPTFLLAATFAVLLLFRGLAVLRSERSEDGETLAVFWALWLAFMPMVIMWITSHVFQPVFLPRALLPSAVIFYVALAWLFTRADVPRIVVVALVLGWIVIIGFGLVTHYTWDTFPTPPFDAAADYLAEQKAPGEVIVHGNKITMLPMVYVDRDLPQRFVRDIPGSGSDTLGVPTQETLGLLAYPCIAAAASGAPRVWYVAFEQFEDEMSELVARDSANVEHDSLGWLRMHYTAKQKIMFNDLDIYLFTDPDSVALRATCEAN